MGEPTPIRDWIESLEREDRRRVLDALGEDWELLGAVALALGPVGSPGRAAELRAAFLAALVEEVRAGEEWAQQASPLSRALERAAMDAVLRGCERGT